ncbi:DUF3817 domain-containing protein [Nocardia sp. NBC_00881]|uniref:DUF3817 domain-containing protein n=1 Tax=Nocardia sp. NBC_00881 TaxID=2975995 RepID=UPI003869B7EC|nr:DUF3817 domain-containing protein [Nocardia sp. NBC_00881]
MVAMGNVFDLSTVAKRFRFVAVLEAISWVFLIVGMVFKRLPEPVLWPVKVFGMTHGIIFVLFVITAIVAARELGWNAKTIVLALLSSIPPFCTVLFEVWAVRAGRLGELSNTVSTDSEAPASVTS